MSDYVADDGTLITEDMIDEWAKEAESGFANSTVTPFEGRAWETRTEPLRTRTIRVSDSLWHMVELNAKARNMSVSEYARQALSRGLRPQASR
jgi:predicted transcriptional regulator